MGQGIRRRLLDPAAGDQTLNVHVLFNGAASRPHQKSLFYRHKPREARENPPKGFNPETRCRALRVEPRGLPDIEPPTPDRVARIIRGAVRAYEDRPMP